MKKTVKIISAVCAIVMLLGMLPIMSVSAADAATLVVTPSREAVKAGREFTVTVALANNPGLWTLKFELTYDANAFEYVKPDANDEAAVKAEAPTDVFDAVCFIGADTAGVISYNRGYSNPEANTSKNGALAVFTFRAKEDATLTGYTFTATVDAINTINVDSQPVAVAGASATAAVVPNVAVSTIESAMVRLGGDIAVNYFVTLDEDHVGAQMRFTFGDEETVVDGEATGYANEYVYIFTGIAPQAMGDNLKAELLFGGEVVAVKDNYSVLTNCQNLLNTPAADLGLNDDQYAAMETLIADLLVYGAKAQLYVGYNTDALVDADVVGATALGEIPADVNERDIYDSTSDTVAFTALGVFFDYTNSIYFKFTAPDVTDADVKIVISKLDSDYEAIDSVEYVLSECELIDEETSEYKINSEDVSVLDFDVVYKAEIKIKGKKNFTTAQEIYYSINSYAYAKQDSANSAMADLAKALYNYGVSAVAFLNA